ncbi:MAG: hypothetical protein H0T55_08580 [Rubrobacteraceae bacterium]|nr:hypothetical protein [Rubrobacteraceae bacterium]
MAAESGADVHHDAPRCLLGLFDAAAGGLADRLEFDEEVERWGIEVRGLSREDLRALVEHRAGRLKGLGRWSHSPGPLPYWFSGRDLLTEASPLHPSAELHLDPPTCGTLLP